MGWGTRVHLWQSALLGAAGGVLAEVLALFRYFGDWQTARRSQLGRVRSSPVALTEYVDVPAHAWMLSLRAIIGAAGAAAFSAEIKGAYVAIALGLAGPTVLARLGELPQVDALLNRNLEEGSPDHHARGAGSKALPAPEREQAVSQAEAAP